MEGRKEESKTKLEIWTAFEVKKLFEVLSFLISFSNIS